MARLVIFFAVHPNQRFHLRDLTRRTRLSSASIQRELQILVGIGAVHRAEGGDRVYFSANDDHGAWRAWAVLLRSSAAPADVLREALVDAEGVEVAFVYGSSARGNARENSDVDLLLVVDQEDTPCHLRRHLSDVEHLIGRPLDVVEYTASTVRERARSGNAFMKRVMEEPKAWLLGDADTFARMVTA